MTRIEEEEEEEEGNIRNIDMIIFLSIAFYNLRVDLIFTVQQKKKRRVHHWELHYILKYPFNVFV